MNFGQRILTLAATAGIVPLILGSLARITAFKPDKNISDKNGEADGRVIPVESDEPEPDSPRFVFFSDEAREEKEE